MLLIINFRAFGGVVNATVLSTVLPEGGVGSNPTAPIGLCAVINIEAAPQPC